MWCFLSLEVALTFFLLLQLLLLFCSYFTLDNWTHSWWFPHSPAYSPLVSGIHGFKRCPLTDFYFWVMAHHARLLTWLTSCSQMLETVNVAFLSDWLLPSFFRVCWALFWQALNGLKIMSFGRAGLIPSAERSVTVKHLWGMPGRGMCREEGHVGSCVGEDLLRVFSWHVSHRGWGWPPGVLLRLLCFFLPRLLLVSVSPFSCFFITSLRGWIPLPQHKFSLRKISRSITSICPWSIVFLKSMFPSRVSLFRSSPTLSSRRTSPPGRLTQA